MLPRVDEDAEVPHVAQLQHGDDVFQVETIRPDGAGRTIQVVRTNDGYLMDRDGLPARTGPDPVALVQGVLVVDAATGVRITPATWGPAVSELLAVLRIDPSALDGEQDDDRFDIEVDGLDERIVAVPCWVGDCHVAGLVHEGRVVPVLVNDDEEGLAGEELASCTWSSESGGAPVSWSGGAELLRLNGRLGLERSWGDEGSPSSLAEVPVEPEALAERIAGWLSYDRGSLLGAAFAYEPFDPDGSLSAEERAQWEALLVAPDLLVTIGTDADTRALVLRVLEREDDYAALQDALMHPTGSNGQELRRALERFVDDGRVLDDLLTWRRDA